MFIPDPDLNVLLYPSRIPDPGVKKAPDPDLQHCFVRSFLLVDDHI